MKIFCYLIWIINLTFLLWQFRTSPNQPTTQTIIKNQEEIRLASELTPSELVPPAPIGHCYLIGPLTEKDQSLIATLAGLAKPVKLIDRNEPVTKNYQVFFPGGETEKKSQETLSMLKSLGIKDLYPVATGEDKGKISLGIYNQQEQALARKSQLLAQGIVTEIKTQTLEAIKQYAIIKSLEDLSAKLSVLVEPNYNFSEPLPDSEDCQSAPNN